MTNLKGYSFLISIDNHYGGFYFKHGEVSTRLCLGYVAFTFMKASEEIILPWVRKV